MSYISTKTYGPEVGLSCCFRQWRAKSHCNLLHGYALSVKFEFATEELDVHNWVVDFGGLNAIKEFLIGAFDHTLCVASDDPAVEDMFNLHSMGLAKVVVFLHVGCEGFAEFIFNHASKWLADAGYSPRVNLISVEVREHGANSAIYRRD